MRVWQQTAPYLFLVGLLLLVVVLIPGIGREVNGSRRWIPLGFANLQPSELMKFFAVLYAADYTTRKAAFMHDFKKGFLPMAGVMLLAGALLLREPDFGAFVVIISIAMGILFLGGLNWKVFAGLIVMLLVGFVVADLDLALSPAARARLHGSVGRSLRQGLPVVARADRLRPRRMVRPRPGRQRRKTVLPAGSAYRFPARRDRRRIRLHRRGGGDRAVRLADRQGFRDRSSRGRSSSATSARWWRRASASGSACRRSSTWG